MTNVKVVASLTIEESICISDAYVHSFYRIVDISNQPGCSYKVGDLLFIELNRNCYNFNKRTHCGIGSDGWPHIRVRKVNNIELKVID